MMYFINVGYDTTGPLISKASTILLMQRFLGVYRGMSHESLACISYY